MYTLERLTVPFTDEVACDLNAFENTLRAELDPTTMPRPVGHTKADAEHHDPHDTVEAVAVRAADGGVVGVAWMSANLHDNRHLAFMRMGVAARHRRRGVGTQLFGDFVEFAASHDRGTLLLGADALHPGGEAFAASLGAAIGMQAHINRLVLSDVPDGLVQHWIDSAHSAAGAVHHYDLEWVPDNERPEEWLADLAVVSDVLMNDAPMENIPVESTRTTFDQLRAFTERSRALGRDWWTLVARHRASGEPVGYTEIFFPHEDPRVGAQGATAVSAVHRGHALGRWLKATMLERVLRERPEVTTIRTFNADSNDPMLAINHAMGFQPFLAATEWMIERDDAQTWLEKRT